VYHLFRDMKDKDRFHEADRLLDAALDLPASERAAFLREKCGADRELLELVGGLLRQVDETTNGGLATGRALEAFPDAFEGLGSDLSGTSLGRYEIVRLLGRGGMGVVYEGRDDKLRRPVAVKLLPLPTADPALRERFEREAHAAAALNHPNIVAIYDVGEASGRPYLVMELVPGKSLEEQPPRSLEEALAIAELVCMALEHAHGRGVVHRDLKPGNVLVARDNDGLVVKLTDMGIALTRGSARVTKTGAIAGTPMYMAPEQALGQEVDGRADLYALGVMLYVWIAGRPPFEGDDALAVVSQHIHAPVVPPRSYRPDLPSGLEPVILRLLAKLPDLRYRSAREVRLALEGVGTEPAMGATETARAVTIEGLTRGRMVARERELGLLQELWRAAVGGRAHMALISGEPGVGKTRLAREVTATAQLDGARVLSGGCYENEATTPYLPFLEAFRRLVRDTGDEELGELLGDGRGAIALLAPEVDSRLGPLPSGASLPPQEERLRMFDHVARFLGRLAGRKGLLFFIDDLQWADHGSVALLHYLLRHLGTERVLFLGTYREIALDRAHALSRTLVDWNRERLATRVRLDRLGPEGTALMIRTLLGQQEISREFAASLHEETEGNPFFVEEIVKALIAEGKLVHERAGWRRQRTGELTLPQSVKAAIGSRLERISESASEVLRTAAVLGKRFEFAELRSIARKPEEALLDALDEAVSAQLVAPGRGESFTFTHDKIREVLYDELNPIRRRRLHLAIAEGLERLEEQGSDVAVEDLAYHFVQSGEYERGLVYAERAARAALSVYAWEEAMTLLDRARECAQALEREDEMLRLDESMGDAALASGDLTGAAEHYERAIAATGDTAEARNRLRGKVGEAYAVSGDPRGDEHARLALQDLDSARFPREAAQAMMIQARYRHLRGELANAAGIYLEAIELATPLREWDLLTRLYSFLAGTYQHLAEFDLSDKAAERCIEIGRTENIPAGTMLGLEFFAENSYYRGWWHRHIEFNEREEALALETHSGERHGWAQFRAFSLHQLGRLREAVSMCRRGIEHCQSTGDRRLEFFLRGCYALCLTDMGDVSEGEKQVRRAGQEADELNLVGHRITLRGCLSYVLLSQGRFDEAAAESQAGVEAWRRSGSRGAGLIHGAVLAEGLLRGGLVDEARAVLETHLGLAESTKARHRVAQNLRVRGLLHEAEGRGRDALAALDVAVDELGACDSQMELVRALVDRSRLLRGAGRDADAELDLARRKTVLDASGAAHRILGTRT
jgi:tetratricopeptide (TPR) repeat protein